MTIIPITLDSILADDSYQFDFTPCIDISNKEILTFINDISSILKKIDVEINLEEDISKKYKTSKWAIFGFTHKLERAEKLLRVKIPGYSQDILRSHTIRFLDTQINLYENKKQNLSIVSYSPSYDINYFIDRLKELEYIQISKNFQYNNQNIDIEHIPKQTSTPTGRTLKVI